MPRSLWTWTTVKVDGKHKILDTKAQVVIMHRARTEMEMTLGNETHRARICSSALGRVW